MKIKNEIVNLKLGNKQYDFNNLILDEYLKRFARFQLSEDNIAKVSDDRKLKYVLLKFDTPIENIQTSTKLNNKDFDICFVGGTITNQTIAENQISIQYNYETQSNSLIYDYSKNTANNIRLSDYYGRKITAIGFNSNWADDSNFSWKTPVCAVLDTSNYSIYLQENQDFAITRKDIITTDAVFYTNNKQKIQGPAHIAPFGIPQIIEQPNIYNDDKTAWSFFNDSGYGILYSIGLSSYTDYIDKEFIIGQDVDIENNEAEITIKNLENYLSKKSIFTGKDLYPSIGLYPIKSNYKYIILKYKVWQMVHGGTYENITSTPTDTGYYYYQAIPINKFGKSNIKIKYERG